MCHSLDITVSYPQARMAKCARCPYGADHDCYRGVVMLEEPVEYYENGKTVTVKAGFCFDGASIPQAVWSMIGHPMTPKFIPAALLHDALYASHAMPRDEADAIFRDLLNQSGVGYLKRAAMARAVQAFGRFAWGRTPEQLEHFARFVEIK